MVCVCVCVCVCVMVSFCLPICLSHVRRLAGVVLAAERRVTSKLLDQGAHSEKIYKLSECVCSGARMRSRSSV
jgi:hypothetical protein